MYLYRDSKTPKRLLAHLLLPTGVFSQKDRENPGAAVLLRGSFASAERWRRLENTTEITISQTLKGWNNVLLNPQMSADTLISCKVS